jgi:hypothetical protein
LWRVFKLGEGSHYETENIIMEFYLNDEKGVTLLPGNSGSERGIGLITMSKYESQLI